MNPQAATPRNDDQAITLRGGTIAPILVTGATGTVGREIVRLLRAKGQPVRAAVSPSKQSGGPADGGIAQVPFDFGDRQTYGPVLQGVRILFLMRPPAITATHTYIDPFITAAREAGVAHVVFLSLLGAEKIPVVPHHKIEQTLLHSGMDYTFLRPSFFMQNLSGTHRAEIRHGHIVVPAGRGTTSFIDARDVADVAATVLMEPGHEGRAYALTGAEALDYDEVAAVLSQVLDRQVTYTHPGALEFIRWMRGRRMEWGLLLVMLGIYTTARLGLAGAVTDDVVRLLGRPPRSLRQFAEDYRQCWL